MWTYLAIPFQCGFRSSLFFYCFYFLLSVFCKQIINTTDRHGIKSILTIVCSRQSLLEGQLKLFFGAPLREFWTEASISLEGQHLWQEVLLHQQQEGCSPWCTICDKCSNISVVYWWAVFSVGLHSYAENSHHGSAESVEVSDSWKVESSMPSEWLITSKIFFLIYWMGEYWLQYLLVESWVCGPNYLILIKASMC